jgi:hypothetical protein
MKVLLLLSTHHVHRQKHYRIKHAKVKWVEQWWRGRAPVKHFIIKEGAAAAFFSYPSISQARPAFLSRLHKLCVCFFMFLTLFLHYEILQIQSNIQRLICKTRLYFFNIYMHVCICICICIRSNLGILLSFYYLM